VQSALSQRIICGRRLMSKNGAASDDSIELAVMPKRNLAWGHPASIASTLVKRDSSFFCGVSDPALHACLPTLRQPFRIVQSFAGRSDLQSFHGSLAVLLSHRELWLAQLFRQQPAHLNQVVGAAVELVDVQLLAAGGAV